MLLLQTTTAEQTALEVACRARQWKLVRVLVNANTNINVQFLCEPGSLLLQRLDKGRQLIPMSTETGDGLVTALHTACHNKELDMVHFLLEKGADPNIISEWLPVTYKYVYLPQSVLMTQVSMRVSVLSVTTFGIGG